MTTENVSFGRRLLHEIICLNSIHTGTCISFNLFLFFPSLFDFHCVRLSWASLSIYLQLAPLLLLRLFLMSLCTFYLRSIGFREATFPCSRRTDDNSTWPRNARIDGEVNLQSMPKYSIRFALGQSQKYALSLSLSLLNFIGTCHCGRCHSVDEDAGVRIYGEHHVFQFWNSVYFCV